MRRIRWEMPARQIPKHPYRDSAVLYAVLAGAVIGISAGTGGHLRTAVIVAPLVFIAATAYSWWRWRERIRQEERR